MLVLTLVLIVAALAPFAWDEYSALKRECRIFAPNCASAGKRMRYPGSLF
jgi:hypothetical protein